MTIDNTDKHITTVSVAICTYNGEKFIEEQLNSILNQSFNISEIILVDDCSTDKTIEICQSIAKKDNRLKIVANETNIGYNANFNKALSLCSGKYIAISDQDDIWIENKIETMLSAWQEETILMHHAVQWFSNLPLPKATINKKRNATVCNSSKHIIMGNFITGCTILMHRSLLEKALPFPPNVLYDWRLGLIAYYNGKVQFIEQPLIYQRQHDESSFFGIKRSRYDHLQVQISFLENIIELNQLHEDDLRFAKTTLRAYKDILEKNFSFFSFIWFLKNGRYKFWYKYYKTFPFLSIVLECFKIAQGIKKTDQ